MAPSCPKASSSAPTAMMRSCWSLGRPENTVFDIMIGSSMNQYERSRPEVRALDSSSRRNEIRLVEEVITASHAPVCTAA